MVILIATSFLDELKMDTRGICSITRKIIQKINIVNPNNCKIITQKINKNRYFHHIPYFSTQINARKNEMWGRWLREKEYERNNA
jgi:CMP-2-keto-3-deoxyoctulosonic acid synthetase